MVGLVGLEAQAEMAGLHTCNRNYIRGFPRLATPGTSLTLKRSSKSNVRGGPGNASEETYSFPAQSNDPMDTLRPPRSLRTTAGVAPTEESRGVADRRAAVTTAAAEAVVATPAAAVDVVATKVECKVAQQVAKQVRVAAAGNKEKVAEMTEVV